jgi:uncharacterized membrane protein YGL010W
MRSVTHWLSEYGQSHANPTNKLLHWICVPLIVFAVMGLLWAIPVPGALASRSLWINWSTLVVLLALVYYAVLSPALALGVAVAFAILFAVLNAISSLPLTLWATSLAIFVIAWIGQFVGHGLEGKRPSFFKDVQFLLIGPLWLVAALYRRLGISY